MSDINVCGEQMTSDWMSETSISTPASWTTMATWCGAEAHSLTGGGNVRHPPSAADAGPTLSTSETPTARRGRPPREGGQR